MINDVKKRRIVPLRYNEAQIKLHRLKQWFEEHRLPVRIIIAKSRRAGISTGVESHIYDDTTQNPNTYSLIVANERNPSENVLNMCRTFWRYTPEWLVKPDRAKGIAGIRLRPLLPPAYRNNPPKDRLEFDAPLDSKIFVATARSLDGYLGYGFQNIHATEVAYYADGTNLFRALYPTLSTDSHSALYMESTPNGQVGRGRFFYEQCMDAYAHTNDSGEFGVTRLLFIPWHEMTLSFAIPFESPEKRHGFELTLTQAEKDIIKQYGVTLEQLLWRRRMLAGPTFNRDEDYFDQEYPTDLATAFLATGTSVYGRKHIKRLMKDARPPIWEGDVYWGESDARNQGRPMHDIVRKSMFLTRGEARRDGFGSHVHERSFNNLKVWRWPEEDDRIFIGCDVGGGDPDTKDGDWSDITVGVMHDFTNDEIIMRWRGHLNPLAFAEVMSALAWAIAYRVGPKVPMPMLAPEWNGPGVACCTYLDKLNLYPNLYRYQQPGVHEMPKSKHIGWESNAKTKPMMVKFSQRMVELGIIDIPDERQILEMSSYRSLGGFGGPEDFGGAAGRHDDSVSSLQIVCVLMRISAQRTLEGGDPIDIDELSFNDDEGDDIPFDPFAEEMDRLWQRSSDEDDESDEEGQRWGKW